MLQVALAPLRHGDKRWSICRRRISCRTYRITAVRLPSLRRRRVVGHRLAIHGRLLKLTSSQIRWPQAIMAALQVDALFGPRFLRPRILYGDIVRPNAGVTR
jgi:hypothetical protein